MAMIINNRLFPLHLWLLTTGIVGPILISLGSVLDDSTYFNNSANIGVIFLLIPFGLVFSIPTFLIVSLAHSSVAQKLTPLFMKLLIMSIAVAGVFISFSLIGGLMANTYSWYYASGVILSGLILRVKKS